MNNSEKLLHVNQKHPFLWIGALSLGIAYGLARLNIYLGTQVNYLDYLSLFNAMTIVTLACVGVTIGLSIAGLWKMRFKSIPLAFMSLVSFAFLNLLFLID